MTHDFTLTIVVDDTRSNATVTVGGDFDAACVEHFDAQSPCCRTTFTP